MMSFIAIEIFDAKGGAALLMNANNGEIISLVSLPNFDINRRIKITQGYKYTNKITKGVYELGSIFKTFTIALALEKKIVEPETIIKKYSRKIKCSIHEIADLKDFPNNLSVEDILIRSSNIGTILARKVGEKNYKEFIEKTNLLNTPHLEIEELGKPLSFRWNKCKLETISFSHGIAITPLQAAATYAALVNGGNLIQPTLIKKDLYDEQKRLISKETSRQINNILRKVVTEKEGTASLANIYGV